MPVAPGALAPAMLDHVLLQCGSAVVAPYRGTTASGGTVAKHSGCVAAVAARSGVTATRVQ